MTRTTRTTRGALAALLFAAALAALALTGCTQPAAPEAAPEPAAPAAAFPVTITDDASRSVTIAARPEKIVSLAPANTETLFAIGAGDRVVGVTSYDDYPAEVADIAKVGDFSGPNLEAVAAADPDVVFVTTGVQADVIGKLEALGATVVAIDPTTLDGVYEAIGEVGQVTGNTAEADKLVADMKAKADEIATKVASAEKTTAFIEIGQNPLFTAGAATLLGDLIVRAGGANVVAEPGYVSYSAEQLVKANPAVYLATKTSATDAATVAKRPGYDGLAAVKDGRVVILEDNLVSRPGPRIVEGLEQIAVGLHPDAFGQ